MKTTLIVIGVILVFIIVKSYKTYGQSQISKDETINNELEKNNSKIIEVNNIKKEELNKIMTDFCKMYNQDTIQVYSRIFQINQSKFIITFPNNISFVNFCFLVNYIHYPMNINKSFEVIAWEKTGKANGWITEKTANKNIMLFIPNDDKEYDNVYLTTEDNIGYKLGFAVGEEKQLLKSPKMLFIENKTDINNLNNYEFQEFK